jgi:hypothetical protein
MRRMRLQLALVGLGVLVALAGCGASSDDGDSGGFAADEPAPARGADEQAEIPAAGGADEDGGTAGEALIDPRSIIYTGSITVRVADVDDAAATATELAERFGGFVGGDRRSAHADEPAQATLVLRIPSDQFTNAVNELGELGEEESREIKTEDVTEEVVDLETRIATAEASVRRTRDLLDRAESIEDIVAVEKELSEREATLASLQARQRALDDLTALSTITVTLLAPEAVAEDEEEEEDDSGFLAGLASGWRGLTKSLAVLLTGLGVLLPWLVVLGTPTAAVMWWRRRRTLRPVPQAPQDPPQPQ